MASHGPTTGGRSSHYRIIALSHSRNASRRTTTSRKTTSHQCSPPLTTTHYRSPPVITSLLTQHDAAFAPGSLRPPGDCALRPSPTLRDLAVSPSRRLAWTLRGMGSRHRCFALVRGTSGPRAPRLFQSTDAFQYCKSPVLRGAELYCVCDRRARLLPPSVLSIRLPAVSAAPVDAECGNVLRSIPYPIPLGWVKGGDKSMSKYNVLRTVHQIPKISWHFGILSHPTPHGQSGL